MRKNEAKSFASILAVVLKREALNLLQLSSCEMFTFCEVLRETKQTTPANSPECAVQTGNQL